MKTETITHSATSLRIDKKDFKGGFETVWMESAPRRKVTLSIVNDGRDLSRITLTREEAVMLAERLLNITGK